ncbi:zinc finger protein 502-like [Anopheles bellator]|uniref:zinc finger protein 502-like n=1 Tax=Anopheles bellator TaxID=139047 RepID=UPI002647F687|nr:zinc finger protein 502-like [Anopheles bellator]
MRQDELEMADVTKEENVHFPYCYICNAPELQTESGGHCLLFQAEVDGYSPAKALTDILQINVTPELCHSQVLCINCNMLCVEYTQIVQRAEMIRIEMAFAYSQTVEKLAGITEKGLKESGDSVKVESPKDVSVNVDHFEPALQTFEKATTHSRQMGFKDLEVPLDTFQLSIEEAFCMDGLVSDSIIEDPSYTTLMNSSLVRDSQPHPFPGPGPGQILSAASDTSFLQSNDACIIKETDETDLCSDESNLNQLFADQIVEIKNPDGTSVYCIYESGGLGSYSPEENTEMVMSGACAVVTETEADFDAVEEESQALISESVEDESEEQQTTTDTGEIQPNVSADVAEQQLSSANVTNLIHSLFFKVDDMYYCTQCSTNNEMISRDLKNIVHHLKAEHGEKIFVCEQCDAVFQKRSQYQTHLEAHLARECSNFRCDVCGAQLENARMLRLHRKTHVPPSKLWSCQMCNKKYTTKNLLEVHMNSHTGERPYKCSICAKDFSSKYVMAVHMKTHNDRVRSFECKLCGSSFYSRNNLSQHERTHFDKRDYKCTDCGKGFLSQHNLNVHKIIHAGVKPFTCRTCGKSFARKGEIVDHERIHTGEKPFTCDFCPAKFAQRSNLISHRRVTHLNDKRYKCEECGACFKRQRLLLYHTRAMHTGERPYKCEQCEATFVYPEHFQKHKRIHTGKKPYACEVCNKTFNTRDNRNAHRYVHSDKKPFECVLCGAGFMRKMQLYAHMQKRGHLNDTIIVNQPRINANDTLEYTHEPVTSEGGGEEEQLIDETNDLNVNMQIICEDNSLDDLIETDEYYPKQNDPTTEHMLDETSSNSMTLATQLDIAQNEDWESLIVQG